MLYVQASQTPGIDSPHLTRGEREASSDYPLCEVTQFKAFLCKLFAFEFQAARHLLVMIMIRLLFIKHLSTQFIFLFKIGDDGICFESTVSASRIGNSIDN